LKASAIKQFKNGDLDSELLDNGRHYNHVHVHVQDYGNLRHKMFKKIITKICVC